MIINMVIAIYKINEIPCMQGKMKNDPLRYIVSDFYNMTGFLKLNLNII